MRDIQTNESSHSQDLKMTDKKSKPTNGGQSTPMNGRHESVVLEKIAVSNASDVDVDVDGVNVDGSKAKR